MKIYSVTEFREEVNDLLDEVTVAIQGEISDMNISQNRFVWFSLVDDTTVLKCFMLTFQLKQPLEDGMEIQAIGSPTLFKKGQFVFRPRQIELVGEGSLKRAYELLKKKLEKEGLFDETRKRALPRFSEKIGLITSKDAAAYTDVLRILKNRWAGLDIRHMNVQVQGAKATNSIVNALTELNESQQDLDCIILTRGGGSLEDLQAFNTEEVVRAIYASKIPVVCGVGHERDVTLSDLVADVRASTPSNAAEIVAPDKQDVIAELEYMKERCVTSVESVVKQYQDGVQQAVSVLESKIHEQHSRFETLQYAFLSKFQEYQAQIQLRKEQIGHMQQLIHSYNPLHVLKRGYTLTKDSKGRMITTAKKAKQQKQITTVFRDGSVESTVD